MSNIDLREIQSNQPGALPISEGTRGGLAIPRLDSTGKGGSNPADLNEISLPMIDKAGGDKLWDTQPASKLLKATPLATSSSPAAPTLTTTTAATHVVCPSMAYDDQWFDLQVLPIGEGGGKITLAETCPLSLSGGGRKIRLRSWLDGAVGTSVTVSTGSDSTAGNVTSPTIPLPYGYNLAQKYQHLVKIQVQNFDPGIGDTTVYTSGITFVVTPMAEGEGPGSSGFIMLSDDDGFIITDDDGYLLLDGA